MMSRHWPPKQFVVLLLACIAFEAGRAETVPVRHAEGLVHGFLALRTLEGKTIAEGDLTELAKDEIVTVRLVFHFRDKSTYDETATYSQHGNFRLLSDHLVQKGPTFEHQVDAFIDVAKGTVTVRYDDKGKGKVITDQLSLPTDVSNGIVLTLLKNIRPEVAQTNVSMVAVTPKPRLVTLEIVPAGEEAFAIAESRRKAMRYDVKVKVGGITGWLAHLSGKQPPPTRVWILEGEAPAFVKSEGPLYVGGPVWRIELVSPEWPKTAQARDTNPGDK